MSRAHNFSAGPAALPLEVLNIIRDECAYSPELVLSMIINPGLVKTETLRIRSLNPTMVKA